MIYLPSTADQISLLLQSFGFGFLLGILYELLRGIRIALGTKGYRLLLWDFVYSVACFLPAFIFFMAVHEGKLRLFALTAVAGGWATERLTLGYYWGRVVRLCKRWVYKLFAPICRKFQKILRFLQKSFKNLLQKQKHLLYNTKENRQKR